MYILYAVHLRLSSLKQSMLRFSFSSDAADVIADGTNQAASKAQVSGLSRFLIGSTLIEHVQKRDEHFDGALLMLLDCSNKLVVSAASGCKMKWSIADQRKQPHVVVFLSLFNYVSLEDEIIISNSHDIRQVLSR